MPADPLAGLGDAVSLVAGSLGPATEAVTQFAGALSGGTAQLGKIADFVAVFDPTAVELMNSAMNMITATIGAALLPIVTEMTEAFKLVADLIAPLMEDLGPLFEDLAVRMASSLIPVVEAVVEIFQALIPVFEVLNEVSNLLNDLLIGLVEILRLAIAIFSALVTAIVSLFGADLKAGLQSFRDAIKEATRSVILFAVRVAKFFGLTSVIEAIQKAFGPKERGVAKMPTPTEFGITGIEDILKEQTLAAAKAGYGGETKGTEDWLGDISEQIKEIAANQKSTGDYVRGGFIDMGAAILELPAGIANAIMGRKVVKSGAAAAGFGDVEDATENLKKILADMQKDTDATSTGGSSGGYF